MNYLTVGNVISIVVFVSGLIGHWIYMDRRVTRLETRVDSLEKSSVKLELDIVKRLEKLEDKIDKLIESQLNKNNNG